MTVAELIEELKKQPLHWPVVIESPTNISFDVYEIVELQSATGKGVHGMASIHIVTDMS